MIDMGGDPGGAGEMPPHTFFEGDGYGTVPLHQYFAMGN